MQLSENTCVQILYKMMLSRFFEEMCVKLSDNGLISEELYLSSGREASAAAVCALNVNDLIFSSHRGNTVAIAAGVPAEKMFAELLGLPSGVCGGRSGLSGMSYKPCSFFGSSTGGHYNPLRAAGAALGEKLRGSGRMTACFLGEGAAASAGFYEAVSFSQQNKVPILYYIENTSAAKDGDPVDVSSRLSGLGIVSVITDGSSPPDVYTAVSQALEFSKQNSCPVIVEAATCSYTGDLYVGRQSRLPRETVLEMERFDPIEKQIAFMTAGKMGDRDDLERLRNQASSQIGLAMDRMLRELSAQGYGKRREVH